MDARADSAKESWKLKRFIGSNTKVARMLDRREFALGAVSLLGMTIDLSANGERVFRVANPNGIMDATQCFVTCGQHPKLGYYATERVARTQLPVNSVAQAMMSVVLKEADATSLGPPIFLPATAKEPDLGLIGLYNWLPRNNAVVVVKADSPAKTLTDLSGKNIGIRNQGDGAAPLAKLMFSELGLKADDNQFIAVGDVGIAGNALNRGQIDAFITYDTIASRIEALGFPLRYLPLTPSFAEHGVVWYGVRKSDLKEDRKSVVGILRATAKCTLFAYSNLPIAIQIHWSLYPDSKPKTKTPEEGLKEMELILARRRESWIRNPADPGDKFGLTTEDDWKYASKVAVATSNVPGLAQKLGNPGDFFSNELIDEINDFDKAEVIRQAKEFVL